MLVLGTDVYSVFSRVRRSSKSCLLLFFFLFITAKAWTQNGALYRVNAGGPELTYQGNTFEADAYFAGGGDYDNDNATVPALYQTERSSGSLNFGYNFPVENGQYTIVLHFAEIYWGANGGGSGGTGKRIFDVLGEGQLLLDDFDITSEVGPQTAFTRSFVINVSDGELNLLFESQGSDGVDQPKLSALELYGESTPAPLNLEPVADQSHPVSALINLPLEASGGDTSQPLVYGASGLPAGLSINSNTGLISGVIDASALNGGGNNDGNHQVTLSVSRGNENAQTVFNWVVTEPSSSLYRINAGGPELTFNGEVFEADSNFNGGKTYSNTDATVPALYQTERSSSSALFSYDFVVPNGNYEVILHFAEIYYGANGGGSGGTGKRVFDVLAENNTLLDDYDLTVAVGPQTPIALPFVVTVSDGELNLVFDAQGSDGVDEPKLSALEVRSFEAFPSVELAAIANQSNEAGDSVTGLQASATGGNPAQSFSYSIAGQPEGITIDETTGSIGGQIGSQAVAGGPNGNGIHLVTVQASKGGIVGGTTTFEWTITGPALPFTLEAVEDRLDLLGSPVEFVVSATGGESQDPVAYSMSGAPIGVSIDATTGVVSGLILAEALTGGPNGDGQHQTTITASKTGETDQTTNFSWDVTQVLDWNDKEENEFYEAKGESGFVQLGEQFYIMGGLETRTTYSYNHGQDQWSELGDAPLQFNHFQPVAYKGYIWVLGALTNVAYPTNEIQQNIWLYDPRSNDWIEGDPMPEGRQRGSAGVVVYEDKFYMVGGSTNGHNGGYVPWFDEYDPETGEWRTMPDAPRPRDHFYAVVAEGKLYAVGGRWTGGAGGANAPNLPEVDVYDFATQSWSTLPDALDLPTPRAGAPVAYFDNQVILMGGEIQAGSVYGENLSEVALQITEGFDLTTQTWSRLPDMQFPRHGTTAVVSGSGLYLASGAGEWGFGTPQNNMEYYGVDSPQLLPLDYSDLTAPASVYIAEGQSGSVPLQLANGTSSVYIRGLELLGPAASDYSILSGDPSHTLLSPGDQRNIVLSLNATQENASATLRVLWGSGESTDIELSANILLSPGDQVSAVGDQVDLTIQNINTISDYTYEAVDLPNGLQMDSATAQITGQIQNSALANSPHTVEIRATEKATQLVYTLFFDWEVIDPTVLTLDGLGDLISTEEESVNIGVSASGGLDEENFTYQLEGAPNGITISNAGIIQGILAVNAATGGVDGQGNYLVTVTVSKPSSQAVSTSFSWTVNAPSTEGIDRFILIDADQDIPLFDLNEGLQIDASTIQGVGLNIQATTNPAVVGSMLLEFSGPVSKSQTENFAPYALFGDNGNGNFAEQEFPVGDYTLTATAYSESKLGGSPYPAKTINFSVVDVALPTFSVTSTAGFGGTINPAGTLDLPQGSTQGYTMTPDEGFRILDVLVDGVSQGSVSNYTFPSISQNHSIAVSFEAVPVFQILASAEAGGAIDPEGQTTVTQGGSLTFTITADAGFEIEEVLVDGLSQGPMGSYTFEDVQVNHSISASFSAVSTPEVIERFVLVDADQDIDLFELTDGMQVDAALVNGVGLNIRIETNPPVVGSVFAQLSGSFSSNQTENFAPYALFGDNGNGNYGEQLLPEGNYSLTATTYSGSKQSGTAYPPRTISFSIVDNSNPLSMQKAPLGEPNSLRSGFGLEANPVSDRAVLFMDGSADVDRIRIFAVNGLLVKDITTQNSVPNTGQRIEIDVADLQPGIYFVQLESSLQRVESLKLLVAGE